MDVQDQTTHTSPSGHQGHHSGLCHRCGWPYPNPHPSARHRRAHKKICGTIEGYTNLIGPELVSDDEHHSDDDKEETPSPKSDTKTTTDRDGEIRGSITRSEDDVFTDAVTEFADSGSANKSLNKDVFFSFNKDSENDGTNDVVNAPTEIIKVDTSIDVSEKTDLHVEKIEKTESNLELTTTGGVDKDRPTPEPGHVSEPQEAKSIDVTEAGEGKGQESQTTDTITEEAKDSEITKTTPEVSATGEESSEKVECVTADGIKSDCEHVSEAVKESETVEKIKIEKSELDHEIDPEVSKVNNSGDVGEEIKHEKFESDHRNVPEFSKESEIEQTVSVLTEEQIQEVVKEPVAVLTEKKDLEAPALEKSSIEQIQKALKEPAAVSIEKEDLEGSQLEKQSVEHTREVAEKLDCILTEKDSGTPEQMEEVVKEPETVLTEKENLGEPHLEKQSNGHTHEVVGKPDSILTENVVEELDSVLTGKEDLGSHKSEECSKDEIIEQKVNNDSNLVADVSTETITLKDSFDDSIINNKNAAVVVPESVVEEGNVKLKNNEDSGADLSSLNSLEGTWGSVSVVSNASIDAETTEKSKANSEKPNTATSDDFEPPSFMTLVEPESKDNKSGSSEAQDSQPQPNSEASQAGWFPTLTKVNNESEGRKKNEEVMAKVTNLESGKQSTPLKNLLGDAKSPSGKQPEPVVQKDEATVKPPVNDDISSPPKLIEDGKKGKKGKSRSSWIPFVCCSSVNAVK